MFQPLDDSVGELRRDVMLSGEDMRFETLRMAESATAPCTAELDDISRESYTGGRLTVLSESLQGS